MRCRRRGLLWWCGWLLWVSVVGWWWVPLRLLCGGGWGGRCRGCRGRCRGCW